MMTWHQNASLHGQSVRESRVVVEALQVADDACAAYVCVAREDGEGDEGDGRGHRRRRRRRRRHRRRLQWHRSSQL